MNHMHILGTGPSSVILGKTLKFKRLKNVNPNVPKQAEAKRDDVISPQIYNISQFQHGNMLMLSNATNQPKSNVELGYICPRGLSGPPAMTLTK